jgi:uncharacterized protein with HEPN domain
MTQIDWTSIVGMRDRVLYDYNHVNLDAVWDVVTNDIPALIAELEASLPPEEPQQ